MVRERGFGPVELVAVGGEEATLRGALEKARARYHALAPFGVLSQEAAQAFAIRAVSLDRIVCGRDAHIPPHRRQVELETAIVKRACALCTRS
jgi:hypothetical protein